VWGVDHGVEIAKEAPRNNKSGPIKVTGGEAAGAYLGNGLYGAYKARKGRKAAVAGRMLGRSLAEANAGSFAGGTLGVIASRGRNVSGAANAGSSLGAAAGGIHGSLRSYSNAKRRGDIKP
jgi:hypothetical protein